MNLSEYRRGIVYVLSASALWGAFPVVVKLTGTAIPPFLQGALTALAAIPLFILLISLRKGWGLLLTRQAWVPMLIVSLLNGFLYYALVLVGTMHTSPVNTSIILLAEVPLTMLQLYFVRGERLSAREVFGAALVLAGVAAVVFPAELRLNFGDAILLLACMVPPWGNRYAKLAREFVGPSHILLVRSAISFVLFMGLSALLEPQPPAADIRSVLPLIVLNGILLMGFTKILWIESISLLPIAKAVSFGSVAPVFAIIIQWLALGTPPNAVQLFALLPVITGMWILGSSRSD